jgi:hypothetical protein
MIVVEVHVGYVNLHSCNCKHFTYIGKDLNNNTMLYNPKFHTIKCEAQNMKGQCIVDGIQLYSVSACTSTFDPNFPCNHFYNESLYYRCISGSTDNSCKMGTERIPDNDKCIPPSPSCDNLTEVSGGCKEKTTECDNYYDMNGFLCINKKKEKSCATSNKKLSIECAYKRWDNLCSPDNTLGSEKCPLCASPRGQGTCLGCIKYYCSIGYQSYCDISIVSYCYNNPTDFSKSCNWPYTHRSPPLPQDASPILLKNIGITDKDCSNHQKCKSCSGVIPDLAYCGKNYNDISFKCLVVDVDNCNTNNDCNNGLKCISCNLSS